MCWDSNPDPGQKHLTHLTTESSLQPRSIYFKSLYACLCESIHVCVQVPSDPGAGATRGCELLQEGVKNWTLLCRRASSALNGCATSPAPALKCLWQAIFILQNPHWLSWEYFSGTFWIDDRPKSLLFPFSFLVDWLIDWVGFYDFFFFFWVWNMASPDCTGQPQDHEFKQSSCFCRCWTLFLFQGIRPALRSEPLRVFSISSHTHLSLNTTPKMSNLFV